MAIFQLITILVITALTKAEEQELPQPSLLEILRVPDASSVPINYGLPKEEAPEPFYSPDEPKVSILEIPRSYFTSNVNQDYPVPSEELQLPSIEPWNPNNDPKFYYELPAVITKQQQPTNLYPKKYNEDVYEKDKPFAARPKQEINLTPITKEDFLNKQKSINKVLLNMEKAQNQKVIEAEKSQQAVQV